MARPLTTSIPSPPPDYKPSNIPAIDSFFFGRWPHLFTQLAREYRVPGDLVLVLLFLWEATVGAKAGPDRGFLALSQIPVRGRQRDKWLAALEASRFFKVEKAGPHDREGSHYTYNEKTTAQEWEAFFTLAEWLNNFPNWDAVETKKFGRWFKPETLEKVHNGDPFLMFKPAAPPSKPLSPDAEKKRREKVVKTIQAAFAEARVRKEEQQ
jgi:hypothetical protein